MPRSQLPSKLHDRIAELKNSIRNFEYAREGILKKRDAATGDNREELDRVLELSARSLAALNRELTNATNMLERTVSRKSGAPSKPF